MKELLNKKIPFKFKSKLIKLLNICLISFTIGIFISCEGYKIADGYVYDAETHIPLDSVLCKVLETNEEVYTDSTGHYYVEGPFGGCLNDCLDMTVMYTKSGYKTKTILNPGYDNIYLNKK